MYCEMRKSCEYSFFEVRNLVKGSSLNFKGLLFIGQIFKIKFFMYYKVFKTAESVSLIFDSQVIFDLCLQISVSVRKFVCILRWYTKVARFNPGRAYQSIYAEFSQIFFETFLNRGQGPGFFGNTPTELFQPTVQGSLC